MRNKTLVAASLAAVLLVLPACSKKVDKRGASSAAPALAPPASGPTAEQPAPVGPETGALAVAFGETLVADVSASLVASGIDAATVATLASEVRASGVVAVQAGALRLWGLLGDDAGDAATQTAPIVAAFVKASAGDLTAEQTLLLIDKAIATAAKTAHDKGGLDAVKMQTVLADVTGLTLAAIPDAQLPDAARAQAAGATAKAVLEGLTPAGVAAADLPAAAGALAAVIGENAPLAVTEAGASDGMLAVGDGVARALTTIALADPVAGLGLIADGLMTGFVRSPLAEDARLATVGDLPAGLATRLTEFIPDERLGEAVDTLTLNAANALFAGFGDEVSGERLADAAALIAGGPSKGFAAGSIATDKVVGGGLAARGFEAMMKTGLGASALDEASRQRFVFKSFETTVAGLAGRDDAAYVEGVAADFMSGALATAARYSGSVGFGATGDVDEAKLQAFYGGVYGAAFKGMGVITDKSAAIGMSALPRFASQTMTATVDAVGKVVGTRAITADFLTTFPASASEHMGRSLATKLPPADLSTGFANVTGQYMNDVQTLVAARPAIDFNGLARDVTGAALASFGGTFNARPNDMQDAAGYLNAKLGTFKMDAAVYSAAMNGSATVVTNAAKNLGGGGLALCADVLPDALSDADFEADMRLHPEHAVCLKGDLACPKGRATTLTKYDWQLDQMGQQCLSYRYPNVQVAVTCAAGTMYVYGAGCVPETKACDAGMAFVFGLGCQSTAYACNAGMVFAAGNGCVPTTKTFACLASERYVAGEGCRPNAVQTCARGYRFEANACVPDGSAPVCPAGTAFEAARGCVVLVATSNVCPMGLVKGATGACLEGGSALCSGQTYFDPRAQKCLAENACETGFVWDAGARLCRPATAATACALSQFFDAIKGTCVAAGNCAAGLYWDLAAASCRANGMCAPGMAWNPTDQRCIADTATACTTCFGTAPARPEALAVQQGVGSLTLTWTASPNAQTYVLLRSATAITGGLVEGRIVNPRDRLGALDVVYVGPYPQFADLGVTPGIEYFYAVAAANPSAQGPLYSSLATGAGKAQDPGTSAPVPLSAFDTQPVASGVLLTWARTGTGVLIVRSKGAVASESEAAPAPSIQYAKGQRLGTTDVVFSGDGDRFFDELPDADGTSTYYYKAYAYVLRATGPDYASRAIAAALPSRGTQAIADASSSERAQFEATPGIRLVRLTWPSYAPAARYLVTREVGVAPTGVPVTGQRYFVPNMIGSSTVVCATTDLFCVDNGLDPSKTYFYSFRIVVAGQGGPFYSPSATKSAQPLEGNAGDAPPTVSGVDVTPLPLKIRLTWAAPNAAGYVVVRRVDEAPGRGPRNGAQYASGTLLDGTGPEVVVGAGPNLGVLDDQGLGTSKQYFYHIYAYTLGGNGPVYSATPFATSAHLSAQPDKVTGLTLSSTATSITAAWAAPQHVTGYLVIAKEGSANDVTLPAPIDGTSQLAAGTGGAVVQYVSGATTKTLSGLPSSTGFVVRVYAYKLGDGGVYRYSLLTESTKSTLAAAGGDIVATGASGSQSRLNRVVTDGAGNGYVAGRKWNGSNFDHLVMKFGANSTPAWVNTGDHTAASTVEEAVDLALDGTSIYVATNIGTAATSWRLMKLRTNDGTALSETILSGAAAGPSLTKSIAVGASGVFAGGSFKQTAGSDKPVAGLVKLSMDLQTESQRVAFDVDANPATRDEVVRIVADGSGANAMLYTLVASESTASPSYLRKVRQSDLSLSGGFSVPLGTGYVARDLFVTATRVYVTGTVTASGVPTPFVRVFNKADGVMTADPAETFTFIGADHASGPTSMEGTSLASDGTNFYMGGFGFNLVAANSNDDYFIHGKTLSTGADVGTTPLVKYSAGSGKDRILGTAVDGTYLFIVGLINGSIGGGPAADQFFYKRRAK